MLEEVLHIVRPHSGFENRFKKELTLKKEGLTSPSRGRDFLRLWITRGRGGDMREGARGAGVVPWLLGAVLLIEVARAGGLGWPVNALGAGPAGFTYDMEQLIDELQRMICCS